MFNHQSNHSETNGKSLESLPKKADVENVSLLTIKNGDTNKDLKKSDVVNNRSNGKTKKRVSKNRYSTISLPTGHLPATHPTSYVLFDKTLNNSPIHYKIPEVELFILILRYPETLINMLKGNLGCGILAMGDAYKNGGLLLSPFLTILVGVISIYNQHLLVRNDFNSLIYIYIYDSQ